MIAAAVAEQEGKIGQILVGQVSAQQAESAFKLVVDEANKEFAGQSVRISDMITGFNAQFEDHKRVIEGIVTDFTSSSAALASSTQDARGETKILNDQLTKLRAELSTEFDARTASLASVRKEMSEQTSTRSQ